MATEIEHKFLLQDDSWRNANIIKRVRYRQGYMGSNEQSSIRVRISDHDAYLNIKGATLGVKRQEYEYPIPEQDAMELLDSLCGKPLIEKTRYYVEYEGYTWEIDVFEGDNQGLIVAEIEVEEEGQEFPMPAWVGKEVSDDPRYYNSCLAEHPFKDWT
jgi:adenylate cyclase